MTNDQIEDIFKTGLRDGKIAALRAVWNAGYYQGASITPTAGGHDFSLQVAKPAAVVTGKKK